jgi:glycosyltransferase involved in cell wall biosynthesis|tara:strand:+ start:10130 stop:11347 length:1218 start_codon:yes stop_codon:yes gene_type:complete
LASLNKETRYRSQEALNYDLSWQAVHKGYLGNTDTYTTFARVPIFDEYLFIRKNFHPIWVVYTLLVRLVSLNNPIKEIEAFVKTRHISFEPYWKNNVEYPSWKEASHLISEKPLVSVVIPTLNRYRYLTDVLKDFEKQTYANFEIVVVDQSNPFNSKFYDQFELSINILRQEVPALWLARNTAIRNAKGAIIALSEDDVRVPEQWLENHLRCLDYFDIKISAGVFFAEGSKMPENRSFFAVASQFATGNAMLYKSVFKEIGLFDRQYERQRMGDGEFGARAFKQGIRAVSNPFAYCVDVKAGEGGLRQMGSWDAFRPKNWVAPRPIPSVLYFFRSYFGPTNAWFAILKRVPPSIVPYRFKKNKGMMVLGLILSLFLLPVIAVQVCISWNKASQKINEGPRISELD